MAKFAEAFYLQRDKDLERLIYTHLVVDDVSNS